MVESTRRDPVDAEGESIARPYIRVGAIHGSEEDILAAFLPHPLDGD